jgi:hypothetical protein
MVTRGNTKGKRTRSLKRRLFYAATPTILAFLMIEGLFRLCLFVQEDAAHKRNFEGRSHNPAYTSKPWFSPEFLASALAQPPPSYIPSGTHLVLPVDYKDTFFTIRDGIRATVGFDSAGLPPGRVARRLFLLGGSTTPRRDVPDNLTYASQLQKRLAAIPETRDIEVVNCGYPAVVSLQEVERLKYEIARNNIPDICAFFNGINDINQGVFNGDPEGTICDEERKYANTGLFIALKRIARVSVAAQTIYHSILSTQSRNDPAHTRSEANVRELANATADCYERNMLCAKEICDRYRIRMMVFLQPHVFSIGRRPWTPGERAAADRMRRGQGAALRACYPLLREKLGLLRQRGILAYDISDAFDGNLEPIFVDAFHVESTGNRLIAEAILKRVLPILKDSSSREVALPVGPAGRVER